MLRGKQLATIMLLVALSFSTGTISAMAISRLFSTIYRPPFHTDKRVQFGVLAEHGLDVKAFDINGNCVNTLQIYEPNQNALKMLYGFPQCSPIGQLSTRIGANDDGTRGHVVFNGTLKLDYNIDFGFRYHIYEHFSLGAYLPVRGMRLCNFSLQDLTKSDQDQDLRVKELLTNNLAINVKNLGGLLLGNWERHGCGDLVIFLEWIRDFPQNKPLLKNVELALFVGPSFPTGLKIDEDRIFAVPFGADGSLGVILIPSMRLSLGEHVALGVNFNLDYTFGNTRERRIKTDPEQTGFLLLEKTCVYREYGLFQQYNLYGELHHFLGGLSFKLNYEFTRKDHDSVSIYTNEFSDLHTNLGISEQGWTAHHIITYFKYDVDVHEADDAAVKPFFGVYAKFPVNGSQSVLFETVGLVAAIDF